MARGLLPGSGIRGDALARARTAWGILPDWIAVLAEECDLVGQRRAAEIAGISAAIVSAVLRRQYGVDDMPGSLANVARRVRETLMTRPVDCPALGGIDAARCREWRTKATVFAATNPLRRQMRAACGACDRSNHGTGGSHAAR